MTIDRSTESRLRKLEDQIAIYQTICGYGYAMDGRNKEEVGNLYVEDGVYAVADVNDFVGRERISMITQDPHHIGLVEAGCAHISTLPHLIIEGDEAIATCHTMVARNGDDGFFIGRLSASRIKLARQPDGQWQIVHRQNYMLDGNPAGPALLARLKEGPTAA